MAKKWHIVRYDSTTETGTWDLPGHLSEGEMETILQRLVCSDLTAKEIISASLRKNDAGYSSLLERIGCEIEISFGNNPHYTAKLRSNNDLRYKGG